MSAACTHAHKNLASDLARIETEISNVVDAVAAGFSSTSLKDKLATLEAGKAAIVTKLAEPKPKPISFLPNAAELYRQRIAELEQALRHPEAGDAAREAARALIGMAVIRPRPDAGKKAFDLDLEGALAALLQMAGMRERDAAVVDATSRSSGQLVAGARNHLKLLVSTIPLWALLCTQNKKVVYRKLCRKELLKRGHEMSADLLHRYRQEWIRHDPKSRLTEPQLLKSREPSSPQTKSSNGTDLRKGSLYRDGDHRS